MMFDKCWSQNHCLFSDLRLEHDSKASVVVLLILGCCCWRWESFFLLFCWSNRRGMSEFVLDLDVSVKQEKRNIWVYFDFGFILVINEVKDKGKQSISWKWCFCTGIGNFFFGINNREEEEQIIQSSNSSMYMIRRTCIYCSTMFILSILILLSIFESDFIELSMTLYIHDKPILQIYIDNVLIYLQHIFLTKCVELISYFTPQSLISSWDRFCK